MYRTSQRFLLGVSAMLLSSAIAFGQVATGSISGTVADPNGAAIPGARVIAKNKGTGIESQITTSEAGLYVFPQLAVGEYDVTAEKTGFKKLTRAGLEVRIAARLDLDLRLEVGDVQQSIEVTGEAPLLETSSAMRGQNLSNNLLNKLPLFAGGIRNPRSFVTYMPGVNNVTGEITVAGAGARSQEILIDGASATIPESGGTSFNFPAAEMFGEFKLLTGTFDAEYGRFGGGVEIYVTKSGTNDFHGTLFHNMRRDVWNANAWANNFRGVARPKDRFNEYGAGGGGPVFIPKVYDGRNKSFFFLTYSKDKRPISTGQALGTVPLAAMKRGDFSGIAQTIYDPATTAGNVRTPFAGNLIPTSRFSKIATSLIPAIPDPTRSTVASNFDFINQTAYDRYIYSIKIDHAFNPNNRIAFTVTKENELSDVVSAFPGPLGQGLQTYQKPDNWRWNHDLVIKPNLLMHTTVGYSRTRQVWDNPNQVGAASRFGFPGLSKEADSMPRVQFTGADGYTAWGVQDGKVANGSQINIRYQVSQGFTLLKGAHELKFGWDVRREHTTSQGSKLDLAGSNGLYVFARAQTALPTNLAGSGNAFASLLLGTPDDAQRTGLPVVIGNIRYGYHAGYFQDNWKVNSRLSLQLGMRYDVPVGWHDENGNYSSMNRTLSNIAAGNLPGAIEFYGKGAGRTGGKRPYKTDFSNLGPALGFSFRVTNKTVLRGGYRIYYQTLGNGGCGCRLGFANPIRYTSDGVNGALQWDNGITAGPNFQAPPVFDQSVFLGQNTDVFSDNYGKAPRVQSFSFNIQHEIKNWLLDVAYQGSRSTMLNSTVLINQLPVSRLALGSLLQQNISAPAVVAAGFTKPYASFNGTLAQALRPYPQYLDVSERNAGIGRTWYDSLQTKVERRFGNFQLMGSYTYSKTLGVGHYRQIFSQNFATSGYNIAAQDNYNYNEMKSYLPFDLPHVFNLFYSYELPFGKGKKFLKTDNFLVNLAVGGWSVNAIHRYQSGELILVQAPNTLGNGVLFTQFKKANVGSGPIRTGIDRGTLDPNNPATRFLNAAAFSLPGNFQLGNAAQYYGQMRDPMILNENIGVQKRMRFPITESRNIDLIYTANAFNAFNRTSFGNINGTIGNANYGLATGPQNGIRLITMGLRLDF